MEEVSLEVYILYAHSSCRHRYLVIESGRDMLQRQMATRSVKQSGAGKRWNEEEEEKEEVEEEEEGLYEEKSIFMRNYFIFQEREKEKRFYSTS